MEYSLNDGEWVQTSTGPTVTFEKLAEHFLALFEASPALRMDTEKELNALKISDGDFDVRGLSVWGDLLSALNKWLAVLELENDYTVATCIFISWYCWCFLVPE